MSLRYLFQVLGLCVKVSKVRNLFSFVKSLKVLGGMLLWQNLQYTKYFEHEKILSTFAGTQFLREIKVNVSKFLKYAILTHLGALNFGIYDFLHFSKAEMYQIIKIQSP